MSQHIAFFDPQVEQHQALIGELPAGTEWVVLNAASDGLAQIGMHVLGRTGLSSIHVVSHGSPGALCLGSGLLDSATLAAQQHWLRAIGQSLADDGDLLLYGCNVAAGEVGRSFIASLASLTGVHVAASGAPTGSSARGGDARLEFCIGAVQTGPLFAQASLDRLDVLLGTLPSTLLFNSGGWGQTSAFGDMILSDSIGSSSEVDLFEFVPNTTGSYTFSIPAGSLDAMFRVYGSNGNPITPVIDGFSAAGTESVTLNLTEGLWVQFAVTGFNTSTGAYTVNVNGPDANAPALTVTAPTYAQSYQASIGNQGDIDYWHLTAPAGTSSLNVSVAPTGFDSRIMLISTDNVVLQDVTNGGSGVADTIVNFPVTPGVSYYLAVDSTSRFGTGEYTINLDYNPDQAADLGNPPDSVTPGSGTLLRLDPFGNTTRNDSISAGSEFDAKFDLFKVHYEAGGPYVISTSGGLDTQLRVYDDNGSPLTALIDADSVSVNNERTTVNLSNSGWIYVAVGGFENNTGSYTLNIDGPSPQFASIATPASAFTGSNSGSIDPQGDVDYWQITAPSGTSTLNLSVTPASTLDTLMQLYDSSGVLLETIDSPSAGFMGDGQTDSETGIAVTAGNSYFVVVSSTGGTFNSNPTQTGTYTLNVDFNPDLTDTAPPTVVSFSPADESTGVGVASNVVVTFSEPIQRGSGNIVLRDASGSAVQTFAAATAAQLSLSGSTLTINPSADLFFATGYRLDFDNGSVKDLAGNPYGGTVTYNFTTLAAPDSTAPTVASFSPADESTGVGVASNVVVTFSESIQRGSGNIVLRDASGSAVQTFAAATAGQLSLSGSTLTINPSADLFFATGYRLDFDNGSVKDLAGNPYGGTVTYNFTTVAAPDTTAPTVASFSPADEATGVALGSNIVLNFSENIQRSTGAIVLRDGSGAAIETFGTNFLATNLTVSGNRLTLNPTADLQPGQSYRVDLEFAAVRDLSGNPFGGTSTYNFSTLANTSTTPTLGNDVLTGTSLADSINALAGNDVVNAGEGNDTIDGGPGSDRIDGGGGIDTALFPLLRGDYLLSRTSQGVVTVADKFGTTDTLTNVETIQTASGPVSTSTLTYLPGYDEAPSSSTLVYRFYNDRDKAFFYTNNSAERDEIIRQSTDAAYTPNDPVWPYFYQGATFEQGHTSAGTLPVYRFYNTQTGHHFFTTSEAERQYVFNESTDPSFGAPGPVWPFNYEGVGFTAYAGANHTDSQAVFRFYSPSLDRHFFTASTEEAQEVRLTGIWNDEGVGFYGEIPG